MLKVLGDGELTKKLDRLGPPLQPPRPQEKIEKAGGEVGRAARQDARGREKQAEEGTK